MRVNHQESINVIEHNWVLKNYGHTFPLIIDLQPVSLYKERLGRITLCIQNVVYFECFVQVCFHESLVGGQKSVWCGILSARLKKQLHWKTSVAYKTLVCSTYNILFVVVFQGPSGRVEQAGTSTSFVTGE